MHKLSNLLNVSTAPHTRSKTSTTTLMRDVVIALLPASIFGVYNFGIRALFMILVCIVASVLTEYIYEKAMKKTITIGDYSAVITGLLLGLNMPVKAPMWMGVIGSVFAILVVKMLFGGLGQNFMNPALAARCFLLISFTKDMSDFKVEPDLSGGLSALINSGALAMDGFTGATPLQILKHGESVNFAKLIIGNVSGTIGETSVIAILIGAIYLLIRKVISWRIPVIYLLTFGIFTFLFGGMDATFTLSHIFSGGLMLGAFFMATDYVTSPITSKGQIIFGVALGLLTGIFRIFGSSTEGVSYAIIFSNMLVPLIEKMTLPMAFGKGGKAHE